MNKSKYSIIKELGRGAFGVTYLGYDNVKKINVAIKTIDINKSTEIGADIKVIADEINTLKDLSNDGCSRYMACYYDSFIDELDGVPTVFIISEYIRGVSLTKFISNNTEIEPRMLWPLYLQLILGLNFIHKKGYAHRDIKPDNIMITEDYIIKYIDFGLACVDRCKIKSGCSNECYGGLVGTLFYIPPEIFNRTGVNSLEGSKAHDIWSMAVVMYQMAEGINSFPFNVMVYMDNGQEFIDEKSTTQNIAHAPEFYPDYLLDDGRTNIFLSKLLINNWRTRPNIQYVFNFIIEDILSKPL